MEPASEDADPRPQAPPDRRRRGPPRGLARPQGARRALRVLPQGRAVRGRPGRAAPDARSPARPPGARAHPALRPARTWTRSRVSVIVALPRDRFNAELRHRLQELLLERFNGSSVDYHLSLGDERAGAHPLHGPRRRRRSRTSRSPSSSRRSSRSPAPGTTGCASGSSRCTARSAATRSPTSTSSCLPDYYKSSTDVYLALLDIEQFERLEHGEDFAVGLQNERGQEQNLTRIGLYKTGGKVRLSDFLPILEHLGLTVVEEVPTRLHGDGETSTCTTSASSTETGSRSTWRTAASACRGRDLGGLARRGGVRLAEPARRSRPGSTWRQVAVLRAYRKYRQRVSAAFTEEYQNDAFAHNPAHRREARRAVRAALRPRARARSPRPSRPCAFEILADLDPVTSLDEDRILRAQLGLVERDRPHERVPSGRRYLSFKLRSAEVPDMPKPCPLFEIFVYSPEMEGIHLRGGRVARGGIRWSDRQEDYRTEILGLMKAQMVKNAIIVPVGSKGGFVLQAPAGRPRGAGARGGRPVLDAHARPARPDRQPRRRGEVVHPPDVRVLDDDDPYLVVAADKGTATFSDIANAHRGRVRLLARRRLRLRRLARLRPQGARHHRARRLGVGQAPLPRARARRADRSRSPSSASATCPATSSATGCCSPSRSAWSRRSTTATCSSTRIRTRQPSFAERKRLFELPGSSWDDYDRSKISAGGGVWSRQEKSIPLVARGAGGARHRARRRPRRTTCSCRRSSRAPVDLFWNGGIGTFVKASDETHADVGDRTNDAIRVDGRGPAGTSRRRGRQPRLHAARAHRVRGSRRAHQHRLHRQLGRRRLLRPRGQPQDPARHRGRRRRPDDEAARRAARRGRGRTSRAHVLYDNYLQAQILSQEVAVSSSRIEAYEDLMATPRGRGAARARDRGAAVDRGDGGARPRRARHGTARALRPARVREAQPQGGDSRLLAPGRPVPRPRGAALLPAAGRRAVRPPDREAPAPSRSRRDADRERDRQRPRDHVGLAASARRPAPSPPRSRAPTGSPVTSRRPSARWDDVEALDGKIDPVLQNVLMVGVDTLVEDVARWYLLNAPARAARRDDRGGGAGLRRALATSSSGRPGGLARAPARRSPGRSSAEGVPEQLAQRHAFQPELAHGPDIIAVSRSPGVRSRRSRAHSSSPASASTSTGSSATSWSCPTGLASSAGRARRSATTS